MSTDDEEGAVPATTRPTRPTRREERRAQTVREIKDLAMDQVSAGGPESVSLSRIVRAMSMSPAALYRYFASRDALLADLVVDAYDDLADHLAAVGRPGASPEDHLDAVLRGTRAWAAGRPNAYRLVFGTSTGNGRELAPDRTVPASTRSMSVLVGALAAVAGHRPVPRPPRSVAEDGLDRAVAVVAEHAGFTDVRPEVLALAFLTWTRLHGIISLELAGHLAATGVGADALLEAELATIKAAAAEL